MKEELERKNQIIFIVGRKGSGKSYLSKYLINQNYFQRVFITDKNDEYSIDGSVIFETLSDMLDWLKNSPDDFRAICKFTDDQDYRLLFKTVYELGNNTIIIEELNFFVEVFLSKEDEYFKKLVRYGRHRRIDFVGICQRSADVPRLLTSQSDTFISFQQREPRDLEYISKMFGESSAKRVSELVDYQFAQFGDQFLSFDKVP